MEGQTPLHLALKDLELKNRAAKVVTSLLNWGAQANCQDKRGMTPLHYACGEGSSAELVTLLLDGGANIDQQDDCGMTALHYASSEGYTELVSLLLARGAAVHADLQNEEGLTSLHQALKDLELENDWVML